MSHQPDGKIVAAGNGHGWDFVLARCHPDGSLDDAFGNENPNLPDGLVITDFGVVEWANALVIQSDGKLVAAGKSFTGDEVWSLSAVTQPTKKLANAGVQEIFPNWLKLYL